MLRNFCAAVVIAVCPWIVQAVEIPLGDDLVKREGKPNLTVLRQQLAATLKIEVSELSPSELLAAVKRYGLLVAKANEIGAKQAYYEELIDIGQRMFEQCRQLSNFLEQDTGDDEVLLERLFRSEHWQDLNYVLSASAYWKAWATLGLAKVAPGSRQHSSRLAKSEAAFHRASARILYPDIVYGSWLGLGYIARARGDEKTAERRFSILLSVFTEEEKSSTYNIAKRELAISKIRLGHVGTRSRNEPGADAPEFATARVEEALVLLKQQQETGTGAVGAAKKLNEVIDAGFFDDETFSRVLRYLDQIVGYDLGPLTLLIDAEYAFSHAQYDTAVLKYRDFLNQPASLPAIKMDVFNYHYAMALFSIQQHGDSREVLRELKHLTNPSAVLDSAIRELWLLVSVALQDQMESQENRARALAAAKTYLADFPEGHNKALAHFTLGKLSSQESTANYHFALAKDANQSNDSIVVAQLQRAIDRLYEELLLDNAIIQREYAQEVLKLIDDLPRKIKGSPWCLAIALQMKTILQKHPERLLKAIEQQLAIEGNSHNSRAALIWSKLRVLDLLDQSGLAKYLSSLSRKPVDNTLSQVGVHQDSVTQRQVFQFLVEKERRGEHNNLLNLTRAYYPALVGQTQDQRELRLLEIRVASALGEYEEAVSISQLLIEEFPDSGHAWIAYATAAEQADDLFLAERAWSKIAERVSDGSAQWRKAMFQRITLLSKLDDRVIDLCRVWRSVKTYQHLYTELEQKAARVLEIDDACFNTPNS